MISQIFMFLADEVSETQELYDLISETLGDNIITLVSSFIGCIVSSITLYRKSKKLINDGLTAINNTDSNSKALQDSANSLIEASNKSSEQLQAQVKELEASQIAMQEENKKQQEEMKAFYEDKLKEIKYNQEQLNALLSLPDAIKELASGDEKLVANGTARKVQKSLGKEVDLIEKNTVEVE